jgi:hypothetical protein
MQTLTQGKKDRLLDLKQATDEKGLPSVWFLRRLIYKKKVACIKPFGLKGKSYVLESDIDAFLHQFRVKAVGEAK